MPALQSRYLILIDIDGGAVDGDDLAIDVEFEPAFVGVPFVGAYVATGGVLPYTYTTSAGSLPAGLGPVDASTGIIPGTPTTPGYYEFTASVTDSATIPVTRSKAVAITVSAGINVSGRLAIGEVGIAYSSGVAASGGTPPYTWSTSGSLPPGLGPIDSTTGLIPGTPTLAGTYAFTIIATDSATFAQSYPVTITIVDAVDLSTSNYPDGIVGVAYSAGPTTLFGLGPFTYSLGSGAVPSGTTFYPSSGFVEGTPDTAATYNFDVDVVDSLGGTDTFSATVVVSTSGGGSGVTSLNGATAVVTETSVDGSIAIANTAGVNGNVDLSSRMIAHAATTTALPANSYANGSSGVGATLTATSNAALTAQDGVTLSTNQLLLVKNEASGLKNGLYALTQVGDGSHPYILTRVTRMDTTGEFGGAVVAVLAGTVNAGSLFVCRTVLPTVGTTAIVFGTQLVASPRFGPGCVFTNGGLLLPTSALISEVEVPYAFAGTGWTIVGDVSGSGSIIVSHSTYSAYDTMTTLFTATISSAKKNNATGLTYSLAAGDIIRFSGSTFSGFTRCSIQLDGTPS